MGTFFGFLSFLLVGAGSCLEWLKVVVGAIPAPSAPLLVLMVFRSFLGGGHLCFIREEVGAKSKKKDMPKQTLLVLEGHVCRASSLYIYIYIYICMHAYISMPLCLPIHMYIHMHSSPTFSDSIAHRPTSYSIIQYKVLNGKRMFVECRRCRSDNF